MRRAAQDKPRNTVVPILFASILITGSLIGLVCRAEIMRYFTPTCGPFFAAVEKGDTTLMEQLLRQDPGLLDRPCVERENAPPEPDAVEYAITPLQNAAWKGTLKSVIYIVEKGAAIDRTTYDIGWTPLGMSISYTDNTDKAEYLIKHGAAVKPYSIGLMQTAVEMQAKKIILLLLHHGADVNAKSKDRLNRSPLALVINQDRNTEVVKLLIDQGADINTRDDYGQTPLHQAAGLRKVTNVSQLLTAGASCNALDRFEETPLHKVADDPSPEGLKIASLLLSAGARLDIKDKDGKTPLDLAREAHNTKLIQILQKP